MNSLITITILICICALYFYKTIIKYRALSRKYEQLSGQYATLLSGKKRSEITTGQIAEKLVPFLKYFEHNPKDALFCGNPIDYIVFGEKVITFIEVKTGKARLTKKQRRIKELVQQKEINWEEIRIN